MSRHDVLRYAPGLPLPAQPFRPGTGQPRPVLPTPAAPGTPSATAPLTLPGDLSAPDVLAFRYGVDLYNAGCCWEAHEAWEALWRRAARGSALACLLQGLILLAAARLKDAQPRGQRRLARRARERLREALGQTPRPDPLGLPLAELVTAVEAWQTALDGAGVGAPAGPAASAPLLRLRG
jgi:hypothetical protein